MGSHYVYSKKLPIGWTAPDFELKDGRTKISLEKFEWAMGLVVIFTCNHCEAAQQAWPEIIKQAVLYEKQVAFLAINPDNSEYFPMDDQEETSAKQIELGLRFPFLVDESQKVAHSFQVRCLPEVFVLNHTQPGVYKLFYHGAVGNAFSKSLERLVIKADPVGDQPPSIGCGIIWK